MAISHSYVKLSEGTPISETSICFWICWVWPEAAGLPRLQRHLSRRRRVDLVHALVDLADREAREDLEVEPGEMKP